MISSQVKHSRTSSPASYRKDFHELINTYCTRKGVGDKEQYKSVEDLDETLSSDDSTSSRVSEDEENEVNLARSGSAFLSGRELTVEFLEDETEDFIGVDDFDGTLLILLLILYI